VFNEANARHAANASFDGYLAKLALRTAEHDERLSNVIDLTGGLWGGSILTVATAGTVQTWSTKCILNFSCLGKAFNQWPTRRVS
jgi:hypothetical protein